MLGTAASPSLPRARPLKTPLLVPLAQLQKLREQPPTVSHFPKSDTAIGLQLYVNPLLLIPN